MTNGRGESLQPKDVPTNELERGDRSSFADMFRRLTALAAEILPGLSGRQDLEMRLNLPANRISKDVKNLEDIGISVSQAGRKYIVDENHFPVLVGCEETQALTLALQVLAQAALPEEKHLRTMLERVPENVRNEVHGWSGEQGGIEFPRALADSRPFVEQIDQIRRAIRNGRMLRFKYESHRARRDGEGLQTRRVDRAELIFLGTLYLNAWDVSANGDLQHRFFRLDKMIDVEALDTPVSRQNPPEFEYVYLLSQEMAEMVSISAEAKTTELPDGRLEVRAKAKTSLQAKMHVMRYGAAAEVVSPQSLRDEVAKTYRNGARLYDSQAPIDAACHESSGGASTSIA